MKDVLSMGLNRNTDLAISSIFGKLKANIDFSFIESQPRTVLFTSSLPNEGKTTIAVNTAIAMAASDKKTLILDADMRNPSVHLLFNCVNTRGLSDLISQGGDWRQYIIKPNIPNLYLINAGRKPMNPAKFLTSGRFLKLLEEFSREFDYVVIDMPPVLLVPDSQLVAPHVDGVVLVIRKGKTNISAAKAAQDSLKRANANIIGAVLNYVSAKDSLYGYGYGYGYGKDSKNARRVQANTRRRKPHHSPKPVKSSTATSSVKQSRPPHSKEKQ